MDQVFMSSFLSLNAKGLVGLKNICRIVFTRGPSLIIFKPSQNNTLFSNKTHVVLQMESANNFEFRIFAARGTEINTRAQWRQGVVKNFTIFALQSNTPIFFNYPFFQPWNLVQLYLMNCFLWVTWPKFRDLIGREVHIVGDQ